MTVATRNRRLWVAGAVVVAALAFLLVQGLGNATLYFRTADEAVAQRDSLGTRRFRIEGTVLAGSVQPSKDPGEGLGDDVVAFTIASKDVTVPVLHKGDPPEMFKPGMPVVLEGRFEGNHFASDRILVKHSETYVAEHPERVTTTIAGSPTGR